MAPGATDETIVAVATGAAPGGIGVVRVSGPRAAAIARRIAGALPPARRLRLARFRDAGGATLDRGLVLRFVAPASYTGEDLVELHAHGSPVVLEALVARCVALGARRARPGEFTERAFLHGKLDLAQAEAVADLVAAGSEAQARAALRSLDGEFSQRVEALLGDLVRIRTHVEADIDFVDEELDLLADGEIARGIEALRASVAALHAEARRGQRLRDGLHAVILGAPNVGKSSLLNALAAADRAIVTPIPGTTRDVLRESITLDGVAITLVDTAGLRETDDPVEREGIRRAQAEVSRADLVLWLTERPEDEAPDLQGLAPGARVIVVHTKSDLRTHAKAESRADARGHPHLTVSARGGEGLDALRAELRAAAGATEGDSFSARARHVEALARVDAALAQAHAEALARRAELAAEALRIAQQALGEITGRYTADDLLGAIFASFCIGK